MDLAVQYTCDEARQWLEDDPDNQSLLGPWILMKIGPKAAEMFRDDPEVSDLMDPSVLIIVEGCRCTATICERLETISRLSESTDGEISLSVVRKPGQYPVLVAVWNEFEIHPLRSRSEDPP